MALIDAHTHVFHESQRMRRDEIADTDPTFAEMYRVPDAKMATAPELIAALAEAGFDGAVAAGFAFHDPAEVDRQNEALAGAARCDAIAALATVNPLHPGWERRAGDALANWAAGIGELRPWNQGWDPLGPHGDALCELARATGAVLLWHVSEPVGHEYPGKHGGIRPEELWRLASRHPDVRMVAAHQGGGLPFFLQMPEVRSSIFSVYFDTAATSLLYHKGSIARLVDLAGPDRVLFGSDYPLLSIHRQFSRLKEELAGEPLRNVGGENAKRLFFRAITDD